MKIKLQLLLLLTVLLLFVTSCNIEPPIKLKPISVTAESGTAESGLSIDTQDYPATVKLVNPPDGVSLLVNSASGLEPLAVQECDLAKGCKLEVASRVLAGIYQIPLKVRLTDINQTVETMLELKVEIGIKLSDLSVQLLAGEAHQFSIQIAGTSNSAVTWSATGGSIDAKGLYKAGTKAGEYTITAKSIVDPKKIATASVTIKATGLDVDVTPDSAKVEVYDSTGKKIMEFLGDKQLDNLAAGNYTLKGILASYATTTVNAKVIAGTLTPVKLSLAPGTGMNLDVSPNTAVTHIVGPNGYNKQFTGDQSIGDLKAGKYSLTVSATNYRQKIVDVDIKSQEIANIKVSLDEKIGLDLKPVIDLVGVNPTQPVGTVITVKLGVSGYAGKNLKPFKIRFYWKEPGQTNFVHKAYFTIEGNRGLIAVPLPDLPKGKSILKLVIDEENVIEEDDESNNVLIQNFYGGENSGNKKPTVVLSATPKSGSAPLIVNFTANATDTDGKIESYSWDFDGDNKADSSAAKNAKFTYSQNGTYTATVTVTDDQGGTASDEIVITVGSSSTEVGNLTIDVTPNTAKVTITGPKGFSFTGDKTLTGIPVGNYSITVSQSGYSSKTVSAVVQNNKTTTKAITIVANSGIDLTPVIDLVGVNPTQPEGTVITVKLGASGHVGKNLAPFKLTFYWKAPGETSFTEKAYFTIADDRGLIAVPLPTLQKGTSVLKLVVDSDNAISEDNEANNSIEQVFTGTATTNTNHPPTVSLSATPTTGTYPLTVNYIANASDPDGNNTIVKYEWDFNNDGQIDKTSTKNETYTYTDNGNYTTKVIVTDDKGATASAIKSIVVTAPSDGNAPTISWAAPANNDTITGSRMLVVTVNSVDAAKVDYKLNGILLASNLSSPYEYNWNPTVGNNGTAILKATACDIDGCSSAEITVDVTIVDRSLWVKTLPAKPTADPIVGSKVYGGFNTGKVYSLDAAGTLWTSSYSVSEPITNRIALDEASDVAYVHTPTGYLHAISTVNGTKNWSKKVGVGYGTFKPTVPVIHNNLVYVGGGSENNCLLIFDVGGTEVNTSPDCVGKSLLPTPVLIGGNIFSMERVKSSKSILHKFDSNGLLLSSTAQLVANLTTDSLSVDGSYVLAASAYNAILKINSANLSVQSIPVNYSPSTAVVVTPSCYAINSNGSLVCLNKTTGELIWSVNTAMNTAVKPVYDAQRATIYAVSDAGLVRAIEEDTGIVLWTYDLNDLGTTYSVKISPVILNDVLVIVRYKTAIGLNLNY